MKRIIAILITALALSACGTTKEIRRANRASKKLEKLTLKFPELLRQDTLRDTVPAIVTRVRIDTAFIQTSDTITLEKERLRVRVIHTNDTIRITAQCAEDTIFVPVEIPTEKIQPIEHKPMPLKKWQQAAQISGFVLWIILLILLLVAIIARSKFMSIK